MRDIQQTGSRRIKRTAPITAKERAYNSLRNLSWCQISSNGHLLFEAPERSPPNDLKEEMNAGCRKCLNRREQRDKRQKHT